MLRKKHVSDKNVHISPNKKHVSTKFLVPGNIDLLMTKTIDGHIGTTFSMNHVENESNIFIHK